jgi:phosphoserine phosphatase
MIEKPTGLVAFDLDGTLLRGPTVCEVLAARLGRLERMQEIEALTDQDEIAAARSEIAEWYRDYESTELLSMLGDATLAPNARAAIALLQRSGFVVSIASITWEFAVAWFAEQLGIRHFSGTALSPDGRIGHEWPIDKARRLQMLAADLAIPKERTAAVGDSAGDVPLLKAVGHPFFVGSRLPPGLEGVTHLQDADMLELAKLLIQRITRITD